MLEVEPLRPSAETAQRFEMNQYYRCRLKLDDSPQTAVVYTDHVPKSWQKGAKPNADGGACGVFLKLAGKDTENTVGVAVKLPPQQEVAKDGVAVELPLQHEKLPPQRNTSSPIFAAPRLACYPSDLLGSLGMDFGLLDSEQSLKPFNRNNAEDRESFYQLLAAVGRSKPGQLLHQADDNLPNIPENRRWTNGQGQDQYSVVPFFNEPVPQIGQLAALSGTAQKVEEIHIDDPDVIARCGIRRYYQVSLFSDDADGNPVTFCILDLPKGMPFGALPHYGESVRIAGFFFKTWSYSVPKMTDPELSPRDHQPSPLLIGRDLLWTPAPKPADSTISGYVVAALFVLAVAIAWVMAWKSSRREKRLEEHVMGEKPNFDAGINLEQPVRPAADSPDFNIIAQMDHGPENQK